MNPDKRKYIDLLVIAGIGLAYFLALKIHQYFAFGVHGELADFESILWNTLHGRFFIKGAVGVSFFAEHFSPILLLLVPLYALFSSPVTLLIIQALAAALAVIPLYLIARMKFSMKWAAVAISLSYLFSRVVNYGLMYDFHMEIFYPLLFFWAFWAWERKLWKTLFIFLILALMVKEDAGVAIIGLGFYLISLKYWRRGIAIISLSAICITLFIFVIIPHFRSGQENTVYPFLSYWSGYGKTPQEILVHMLNPLQHIRVLFTMPKMIKMFNLFSVFLFLPLLSWRRLLFLILPGWFMLYSSDNPLLNGPLLYYGLLIIPFLFYSSVLTLDDIQKKWPKHASKLVFGIALAMLLVNFGNSRIFKQSNPANWRIDRRFETAQQLIKQVPKTAAVSSQVDLQSHFPVRADRYLIPDGIDQARYLLFDTQGNSWLLSKRENAALLDSLKRSSEWEVLAEKDGFVLMRRSR